MTGDASSVRRTMASFARRGKGLIHEDDCGLEMHVLGCHQPGEQGIAPALGLAYTPTSRGPSGP
jgi:hypothetical protein